MNVDIANLRPTNISLELHPDGVLVATLCRPAKRNALDAISIENLIELFSAAPRAGVSAVVLTAEGDHFCAGLDLAEHRRSRLGLSARQLRQRRQILARAEDWLAPQSPTSCAWPLPLDRGLPPEARPASSHNVSTALPRTLGGSRSITPVS